jgi:CBS domain-containing protein
MTQTVREVMTADPVQLDSSAPLVEAARRMRDADIGDVIVMDGGSMCGVVTDRDIVVRAIAEGKDPQSATLSEICSHDVVTVSADDSVERAIQLMRERAIRRLPVVEGGRPIGVVSIGDLAVERDEDSGLAEISAASPNN